ncbi:MAG: hypothetical protein A3D16_01305 [Rhodobacterales bacterium RIFCSPHIGHO2_02_FULL_62_130]|nr:MAG: hypothetical protein A3D16_01305 [Rhodobacterales bacterium RIFCSPHIGHO2_02_FULL_62_130]OHC55100.1 MAG: hypothetical protein A3E48_10950 [Rhodobacterales bacterium RIFCSPHIGHO2_12_FULL_62_75]HCZ00399.1 hypothetical protein [Rhodobacter sp.]
MTPRAALIAGILATALGLSAQAEGITVSPKDLSKLAAVALSQQDPATALRFTAALLTRDAQDATALILKSQAERDLGRNAQARLSAKAAWAAAQNDQEKYGAAMAMAQALSSSGRRTAAQLWLRRASEVAPSDIALLVATRDFDYVRSRNPLSLRFDIGLRPSSNLNNGATNPMFEFMGFPFQLSGDALALSGVEASAALSGQFRLADSEQGATDLRFAGSQKLVWLSDKAQAQAPEARNSDYAFAGIELGLARRGKLGLGEVIYSASLGAGHNWYGGADLTDYARADLGLEAPIGRKATGFALVSAETQHSLMAGQGSAQIFGLTGGVMAKRGNGDTVKLALDLGKTRSDIAPSSYDAVGLTLDYTRARPVLGVVLAGNLGLEARDYPVSPYDIGGRQDFRLSAGLSATLTQISYMGFSPVLSVTMAQARSTVAIYETQTLGVGLSVRSNF